MDTRAARSKILRAIGRHAISPAELPQLEGDWIHYDDVASQFIAAVESVGGTARIYGDRGQLREQLSQWPAFADATCMVSLMADLGRTDLDLTRVTQPHSLRDVDCAIIPGEFGVAENGAVWVSGDVLPHRVLPFLTQHLVLVVSRQRLYHHLGEAYGELRIGEHSFGVFISGPSKTADIEQSLVIGAHGARSLLVALVED
jgi:L-lactate dehydrogenase complex protein LldG